MNAKIKKINAEYEKNAAKIAELQARQKELDKQRTELENLDIVGMVRSMGMTPEELAAHPANCFVGGVVGRSPMNFFLMKVFSEGGRIGLQGASGRMLVPEAVGAVLENNGYVGKEVITGVRAEDVCLSRASEDGQDGHFSARFQSMTGDGTMLRFQAEDADGICQAEGRTDFRENEKIYLFVDAEKIYLFDKDTEKNIL